MNVKQIYLVWVLLFAVDLYAAEACAQYGLVTTKTGLCVPNIRLHGDLAKIFAVDDCERISGLTCRIKYNGSLPLPSEVFFRELDSDGKVLGNPVRLIYPELKPKQWGVATFRIRHESRVIELRGKWEGPWKNPY